MADRALDVLAVLLVGPLDDPRQVRASARALSASLGPRSSGLVFGCHPAAEAWQGASLGGVSEQRQPQVVPETAVLQLIPQQVPASLYAVVRPGMLPPPGWDARLLQASQRLSARTLVWPTCSRDELDQGLTLEPDRALAEDEVFSRAVGAVGFAWHPSVLTQGQPVDHVRFSRGLEFMAVARAALWGRVAWASSAAVLSQGAASPLPGQPDALEHHLAGRLMGLSGAAAELRSWSPVSRSNDRSARLARLAEREVIATAERWVRRRNIHLNQRLRPLWTGPDQRVE